MLVLISYALVCLQYLRSTVGPPEVDGMELGEAESAKGSRKRWNSLAEGAFQPKSMRSLKTLAYPRLGLKNDIGWASPTSKPRSKVLGWCAASEPFDVLDLRAVLQSQPPGSTGIGLRAGSKSNTRRKGNKREENNRLYSNLLAMASNLRAMGEKARQEGASKRESCMTAPECGVRPNGNRLAGIAAEKDSHIKS